MDRSLLRMYLVFFIGNDRERHWLDIQSSRCFSSFLYVLKIGQFSDKHHVLSINDTTTLQSWELFI